MLHSILSLLYYYYGVLYGTLFTTEYSDYYTTTLRRVLTIFGSYDFARQSLIIFFYIIFPFFFILNTTRILEYDQALGYFNWLWDTRPGQVTDLIFFLSKSMH